LAVTGGDGAGGSVSDTAGHKDAIAEPKYETRTTLCYLNRSNDFTLATAFVRPNQFKCWRQSNINTGLAPHSGTTKKQSDLFGSYTHTAQVDRKSVGGAWHLDVNAIWGQSAETHGEFDLRLVPIPGAGSDVIYVRCGTSQKDPPESTNSKMGFPTVALPQAVRCGYYSRVSYGADYDWKTIPTPNVSRRLMNIYPGMRFYAWRYPKQDVRLAVGAVSTGDGGRSTMIMIRSTVPAALPADG
jgi:hypothetical protein